MLARNIIWPSLERVIEGVLRIAVVLDYEAEIVDPALAAHALQIGLPALAVGRIGEHEVELAGGESVCGQGGAVPDVGRFVTLSLEDQVRLAYGIGLRR